MNRRLLPRHIFVPTAILYNKELPAAVALTWIQLRGLAWDGWITPPLPLQAILKLTHKSKSTLYSHLALLELKTNLRYHFTPAHLLVIAFPEQRSPGGDCARKAEQASPTAPPEPDEADSYFPRRIMGYISYEDDEEPSPSGQ